MQFSNRLLKVLALSLMLSPQISSATSLLEQFEKRESARSSANETCELQQKRSQSQLAGQILKKLATADGSLVVGTETILIGEWYPYGIKMAVAFGNGTICVIPFNGQINSPPGTLRVELAYGSSCYDKASRPVSLTAFGSSILESIKLPNNDLTSSPGISCKN